MTSLVPPLGFPPGVTSPPAEPVEGLLETTRDEESLVDLRCSVAVMRGSDVLVVHRSDDPQRREDGDWVLPGGRAPAGESMVACARRETLEETGLDVVVRRCLFVLEVTAPRSRDRVVELIFAAETPNGAEPVSREQHRHPGFVPLDRLQHLHLRPPVAGHLRALTGRRSAASGAPYIGNLWRPDESDETDETDPYWS